MESPYQTPNSDPTPDLEKAEKIHLDAPFEQGKRRIIVIACLLLFPLLLLLLLSLIDKF